MLNQDQIIQLALDAQCDTRTVQRYLAAQPIRPGLERRIIQAAKKTKLDLRPGVTQLTLSFPSELVLQGEAKVRELNERAVDQGSAPSHSLESLFLGALEAFLDVPKTESTPRTPSKAVSTSETSAGNVLAALERLKR